MNLLNTRRKFLGVLASAFAWLFTPAMAQTDYPGQRNRGGKGGGRRRNESEEYSLPPDLASFGLSSLVVGRAGDRSVAVSALAKEPMEGYFQYGTASDSYDRKTGLLAFPMISTPATIAFVTCKPTATKKVSSLGTPAIFASASCRPA
jgi:hypothetical protein